MSNQSGKIILVLALILLLLGAAIYFFLPGFKKESIIEQAPNYSSKPMIESNESTDSAQQFKDYYSKALKISIRIPNNAKIEERFTDILITLPDGIIQIRRIGTNFSNIKEYMKNLKIVNKLSLLSEDSKRINDLDFVLITMEDPNAKSKNLKEYSVYKDKWVFKFSTSEESLYPVLDQIVQSFEYKP